MDESFERTRAVYAASAQRLMVEGRRHLQRSARVIRSMLSGAPSDFERRTLERMADRLDQADALVADLPRVPGIPETPEPTGGEP